MSDLTQELPAKQPLYIIDAYQLIYRTYFAYQNRPLRNNNGKNISVLNGVAQYITGILNHGAPSSAGGLLPCSLLVATFDSKTPTFRHQLYSEYKAKRQKAPEELHEQVPLVEEFLSILGIPALYCEGFEADDIIASLVRIAQTEGRQCYIMSNDKDLLQLVGNGTFAIHSLKSGAGEVIGPDEVIRDKGVPPEKILDYLSITGDVSDNIPGIAGIGEKGAQKLLSRYESLDDIYENIAGIDGPVGKKLVAGKEAAYFAQNLVTLRFDVPLNITNLEELTRELNRDAAAAMLQREGIKEVALALQNVPHGAATPDAKQHAQAASTDSTDPALIGAGSYRLILSIDELKAFLDAASVQGLFALDFETDSLDAYTARPIGVSLAITVKEAVYVPLAPHGNAEVRPQTQYPPETFLDPAIVRDLLASLLADANMTVVAHNAKYDYKVSRGWGIPPWNCTIYDTMVAAWLADPDRNNYSLDSLTRQFFNAEPISYDSIVPKGWVFDSVSLETACAYSGEDADYSLRTWRHLEAKLAANETLDLFKTLEMPLLPLLAEMEIEGIRLEPQVLRDYGKELAVKLDAIQAQTWATVGHEFNLGSPKQLQEVLYVERKLVPSKAVKKTKTGYSTDAAALEELSRLDPVPALILQHRSLAKLKSTYIDTLADSADSNGRVHTNFIQTGAATGRLSSRDPNLQNIPIRDEEGRKIREAFIAKSGCVLISADYGQIELVLLAHFSGDENLCVAFRDGKDVHARTAALIFGIPETEVRGEQRRIAKVINFGVIYGMSAFRLSNELNIHRAEAQAFIDAYYKTYSGITRFMEATVCKAEETGYVSTLLGRRRYIAGINSRNNTEKSAAQRVAINTPIQGSAADIVKLAMLNVNRTLSERTSPAKMLLQVHDELIFECPEAAAPETAALIKAAMEQSVSLLVPLRVSVESGKCWGDFH
ncbi:DNA polymerase I [Spirochaetia bacterium]|nr:DNA polymerase I [Spirochaetia bacterium]